MSFTKIPIFASITVHEEFDDLVDVVRLGESCFAHFRSFVSEFRDLARDLCLGKQRASPFYHD